MAEGDEIIVVLTVDGKTSYDVEGFTVSEALSEVPTYRVTILDQTTKLHALLGKSCAIGLVKEVYADAKPRAFEGLIMSAERTVASDGSLVLNLMIRPSLAVLGLSSSCTVYEKKTCVDILKEVLKRNKLTKLKVAGSTSSVKRPVVIQYNENDLSFVRRILAEEGLTFFFGDGKDPGVLMLHDTQKPFPTTPAPIKLTDAELTDVERIEAQSLTLTRQVMPGRVELRTYDPGKADDAGADKALTGEVKLAEKPQVLEYRPVTVPVGEPQGVEIARFSAATLRPELGLTGVCEHPGMHLGQGLNIASDGHADLAGDYVIVGLRYSPVRGNALACAFDAVPKSHKAAPERLPKPLIAGVHNAIVIGGSGTKAGAPFCDAEGRVHVRFFWDTEGKNTVWLRVSEPYAGKGYGAQFIPRVGHEVLVSFLNGDPDAPIITGQIYNDKHKPPFIEKNTTRSGIRSKLDGEPNEWEFDDKAGAEMIALRAARDYTLKVNNDVLRDIKKLETTKIGETCKLTIGKNYVTDVTEKIEIDAKTRETKIKTSDTLTVDTLTVTAKTKVVFEVGGSKIEMTASGIKVTSGQVSIKGSSKVEAKSAGKMLVQGMATDVKASTALKLGGLNVDVKAGVMFNAKGTMATVQGSGMLTLKGGICMIN